MNSVHKMHYNYFMNLQFFLNIIKNTAYNYNDIATVAKNVQCNEHKTSIYSGQTLTQFLGLVASLGRILIWAATSAQRPNVSGLKVTVLDRFHC